jgi:hypothetical protein
MNPALRKEIRLLLPVWIVALAAATVPLWASMGRGFYGGDRALSFALFEAGALLLCVSSFGSEMSFGTFPSLLAEPRPRLATWRLKTGLLASALALVVAAAGFSWRLRMGAMSMGSSTEYVEYILLLALMAFVGGLWTTLLFRQTAVAFWTAFLVPWLLFLAFYALEVERRLRLSAMESWTFVSSGYAVMGYFLARWLFLRAQVKPEREATDALSWSFLPAFRTRRGPMAALLVKEVRLQQGTLVFAVVLILLYFAAVAWSLLLSPAVSWKYPFFQILQLFWLVAPFLVGCCSVAEERRTRTLESTLCLPIRTPFLFAIKLLVVFGLGILLGAVMPWLLNMLQPGPGLRAEPILRPFLLLSAMLTAFGCYGSSASTTFLQAFGAAALFALMLIFVCLPPTVTYYQLILITVSICLSYGNFKQLRMTSHQWLRNFLVWLAVIGPTKILWFILAK